MTNTADWAAFADTLEDLTERARVAHFVSVGQAFLSFTASIYKLTGDMPQIFLSTDSSYNAKIAFGSIILNTGVIEHALKSDEACYASGAFKSNDSVLIFASPSIITFIWTLAHEFFHYARQHSVIATQFPGCDHALEYDADSMATVAVYRFVEATIGIRFSSLELKRLVAYSLFWPIRLVFGSTIESSSTHPNTPSRLYTCVALKLSKINNENNDPNTISQTAIDEMVNLATLTIELDRAYLASINKDPKKSILIDALWSMTAEFNSSELAKTVLLWEKIAPHVEQIQLLTAFRQDMEQEGIANSPTAAEPPEGEAPRINLRLLAN